MKNKFDEMFQKCTVDKSYANSIMPSTKEGCVVRISDMIAYAGKDRQDLKRAGLITEEEFKRLDYAWRD